MIASKNVRIHCDQIFVNNWFLIDFAASWMPWAFGKPSTRKSFLVNRYSCLGCLLLKISLNDNSYFKTGSVFITCFGYLIKLWWVCFKLCYLLPVEWTFLCSVAFEILSFFRCSYFARAYLVFCLTNSESCGQLVL